MNWIPRLAPRLLEDSTARRRRGYSPSPPSSERSATRADPDYFIAGLREFSNDAPNGVLTAHATPLTRPKAGIGPTAFPKILSQITGFKQRHPKTALSDMLRIASRPRLPGPVFRWPVPEPTLCPDSKRHAGRPVYTELLQPSSLPPSRSKPQLIDCSDAPSRAPAQSPPCHCHSPRSLDTGRFSTYPRLVFCQPVKNRHIIMARPRTALSAVT